MSGAATPTAAEPAVLDDRDMEPRTPMKRLGSTRKLAAFNNIRLQLSEQTRVLEARAEAAAGVAGELHDYCRRRADVEHEYSRALDKLARAAHARHKDQKHKREQWQLTGAYACWQAALEATRALSRDHAALADLYGGPLATRLQRAADDALRLHRKCRDIVVERHEEVGAALGAAASAGKTHATAASEWRAAALKLRAAHDARRDPPKHKKIKALDKELEKRRQRHGVARAKALRARAEYVLSLEAANATLQRYYLDDVADIILAMEVGFEAVVGRAARCAAAAETARGGAAGGAAAALRLAADALDALADRQRLLDAHAAAFALPRPLAAPSAAEPAAVEALLGEAGADGLGGAGAGADADEAGVRADLEARLAQLETAARSLRAECRENAKTLDAAEAELIKQMEGSDAQWDVSGLFGAGATGGTILAAAAPPPPEDQEDYYLAKFRAYVSCAGRLARVESKSAALRGKLLGGAGGGAGAGGGGGGGAAGVPARAARSARSAFAAPLELRLPRVLTECVRVIATYGLRHQGVFRVSGSQVEMQSLRAAFERGEDPLAGAKDASDVNSVCGLLKLYLREVRPPLLPPQLQERLLRVAALPDDATFIARLRSLLSALPLPAILVLRYLFAFLAHLAENARYNMMDAWNLAICVGPTLLAAWGDGPHQLAAQNLVNELVKRTIIHHAEVFPQDVAPHALYPRYGEAEVEKISEDAEAAVDGESIEADEPDASLHSLPDDDSDTEEETSDECENGEWGERDSNDCHRSGSTERRPSIPPQVREASPAPSASTAAAPPANDAQPSTSTCCRLAESTPDLVLDLPARPPPPASPAPEAGTEAAPPSATEPAPADPADTFAHNRDTLKKRPQHKQSRSEGSAVAGEEESSSAEVGAGGSPVPARNTARVAAKFAELTLTGGSLKPALAAKPALLRRPTPHPHAPRSAPPAPPTVPPDAAPQPDDPAR